MSIPWRIELLGGLQARQQERLLTHFETRKTAALLAYLALFPQRAYSREELAERLWPGEDSEATRNRLKQALSALRRVFEPEPISAGSLLLTDRIEVRLNPQAFTTDVAEFEAALHAAFQAETPAAQVALLDQAISLYAGELLPTYYEEWIVAERERLAEAYRSALSRLALAKAKTGDLVGAIAAAHKAVEADPLREASHYDLMRLLVAARRPSEALRQYQQLERTLQEALATTPSRALQSLAEQLRSGETAGPCASETSGRDPSVVHTGQVLAEAASLTNLQMPLSSFIGRESEIQKIEELLQQSRLLTLTGAGGAGKTRLALHVAAHLQQSFPDGAWMVELAPLTQATLVTQALAQSLGILEEPGRPLVKSVCAALADKTLLVILDNCEHLIDACASLAETLLLACPHLRILATSREGLGIAGEMRFRVPSLSLPDPKSPLPLDNLLQYEAVRLFVERARFHQPAFMLTEANAPALTSTCQRLDGLPLAIELAAARVKAMPVEQIAKRLDDRFALLTSGSRTALPRQQTLRALLDWSYQLLSEPERCLFGRLSAFVGGFSLEAAEAVCVGERVSAWEVLDLLSSLVDKSLVLYEEQAGEGRYRMLETIRQYAQEKLRGSQEEDILRMRHCHWCLRLTREALDRWNGPEQTKWLQRLETEHDNLRAALAWCLQDPSGAEMGLLLAGRMGPFWNTRCYFSEGRQHLARALEQKGAGKPTQERASALNGAGNLAFSQGDYAAARRLHAEALAIRQEIGDQRSIAASLGNLGNVAYAQGDFVAAQPYYEQALTLSREMSNRAWEANSIGNLGSVASGLRDFEKARALHEQALAINREIGNRVWEAINLGNLGHVAIEMKDPTAACGYYEQALAICREIGHRAYEADNLDGLGNAACLEGDYTSALRLHAEALSLWQTLDARRGIAQSLEMMAVVHLAMDQPEKATRLYGAALALRETLQAPLSPEAREEFDRNLAVLRDRLGPESHAAAFSEGRALSLDQVIAYARQNQVSL